MYCYCERNESLALPPTQEVRAKCSVLAKTLETPLLFKIITAVGPVYDFSPQSGKWHFDGLAKAKHSRLAEL